MTTEAGHASNVPCTLIDLQNEETMRGYRSGRSWLLHEEAQAPITEEYLIDTIKLLISDGVEDFPSSSYGGTQALLLGF